MISYSLCKIGSFAMTSRTTITNGLFRRTFQYSSSAIDDDFSSPFMEQCTLDAVGVLILLQGEVNLADSAAMLTRREASTPRRAEQW